MVSTGKLHDVTILDVLTPEPGSIYVMDRGYLDFQRLYRLQQARAVFVTRAKKNLACRRLYSRAVDRTTGLFCDQTVVLTVPASRESYPEKLRRVRFRDERDGEGVHLSHQRLHASCADHRPAL
jgi:hypothetical protein